MATFLRAAILATMLAAVPVRAGVRPLPLPREAPGTTWVEPPSRVAIDCPGLPSSAAVLAELGSALDDRGFVAVDFATAVDPSAIVRCAREPSGPPAAGTPAAGIPKPSTAAELAPAEAAPPAVPVVEVPASPTRRQAVEAADRVLSLAAPEARLPRPARVLFLVDDRSDTGRNLRIQASWVVAYARLPADFADATRIERFPGRWLDRYDAVVLASDHLPRSSLSRLASELSAWVERGGAVAAVAGVDADEMFPLLGIRKASEDVPFRSWSCDESFLPGAKGLDPVLEPGAGDSLPRLRLAKGTTVHCRANADDGLPMAFSARRGKGSTFAWAGGVIGDKASRGLLLLALQEVAPIPAATMDALVFYADDCPLPMTGEAREPASGLYGKTDERFYLDLWWPGMKDLMDRHAIRPTTGLIVTYDDRKPADGPPDSYDPEEGAAALEFAHRVRDAGWEIGLHGYNHQSLSVGKNEWTVGWAGRDDMEDALRFARDEYQRLFGAGTGPRIYIAPSNFIQKLGKEALKAVFPGIVGIASQYQDEGPILGQEFGPDPDVDGLVDLPRVSSEHFLDGANSAEVLDALVLPGVFSHFVHPDDFFDPERARGSDWDGMVRRLDAMLAMVDHAYPYLQRMTGPELAAWIPAWRKARLDVVREAAGVTVRAVDAPPGGLPIALRAPRGTTVRYEGDCTETFRAPSESRYHYRVGSESCAITWR